MSGNSGEAIRAVERANQALNRIDAHEKICSERYEDITNFQAAISKKLDEFQRLTFRQWLVVAGGVITTLLTIVGVLLAIIMGWK